MRRLTRKPLTLGVLHLAALLALAVAASGQEAALAPPCSYAEHRQFDFWVGDWVVTREDGQPAGTNRIEKKLNDCVLAESWRGADGSVGESFNMYFDRDGQWHQTWVDGRGGRLDLTGGLVDGSMVLGGTMPGRDGGSARHEITWTPRPDGTVRQHWRASEDGGATWKDLFVGIYSRKSE